MNEKTLEEQIADWPDWMGFIGGGLSLPVVATFTWLLFAGLFPGVEAASHVDDIMKHTNIVGNVVWIFIFGFPIQAFWGALLGLATQQSVVALVERPREARFIFFASGAVGLGCFGHLMWRDWPALLRQGATSQNFAVPVSDAVLIATPFLWSLALLLVGICVRRR